MEAAQVNWAKKLVEVRIWHVSVYDTAFQATRGPCKCAYDEKTNEDPACFGHFGEVPCC